MYKRYINSIIIIIITTNIIILLSVIIELFRKNGEYLK